MQKNILIIFSFVKIMFKNKAEEINFYDQR